MPEAAISKKFNVQISKPEGTATSITVFLPGTWNPFAWNYDYSSTIKALLDKNQIVIAWHRMNPFPIFGRTHDQMAEDVVSVVKEFRAIEEFSNLPAQYNIVGHSIGGKVALMLAAKFDIDNVKKIIALDPVDSNPRELTEPRLSPKTNLTNSQAEEIHLFQSEKGGSECPKDRNASIVKELYPNQITSFEINLGAVHMSYEDSRDDEKSINARDSVHNKIHSVIL